MAPGLQGICRAAAQHVGVDKDRKMKYNTFGPFNVARSNSGQIHSKQKQLWSTANSKKSGVSSAKGLYIFGVKTTRTKRIIPWYVGMTKSQSFEKECFQPHKIIIYRDVMALYKKADPFLFILPRLTPNGRLYKGIFSKDIEYLEKLLIGYAYASNSSIMNKKNTKFWREITLPGVFNPPGRPPKSASMLSDCLQL